MWRVFSRVEEYLITLSSVRMLSNVEGYLITLGNMMDVQKCGGLSHMSE